VTAEEDVHGPIDFVLIEFPADADTSEAGAALLELIEFGIIRLYDIVGVRKEADGSFSGFELTPETGGFSAFAGARSGMVGDDDVAAAAEAMEPGTRAVLLVYENAWAIPFVNAGRKVGAQVIASQRLTAQEINDALDAAEAAG
jgi:hypothetical protein